MARIQAQQSRSRPSQPRLAERAHQELVRRITLGELPAGVRLSEPLVCEMLKMSRTPVREAIKRLLSEGLLTGTAGRSVTVRELTTEEIEGLYSVREAIEVQAARRAALRVTRRELDELRRLCREMDALPKDNPVRMIYHGRELDAQFHMRLVEMSGVEALADLYRRHHLLQLHMFGHHRARVPHFYNLAVPGRGARHRPIVDALATHDPDRADKAVREAMAIGLRILRNASRQWQQETQEMSRGVPALRGRTSAARNCASAMSTRRPRRPSVSR